MEMKEADKIYLIWLELQITEHLEHLVIDDMDCGYANGDEWEFYPQDALFYLIKKGRIYRPFNYSFINAIERSVS